MNKKLMTKIDNFIKDKRKSNGGYAEVKEQDIKELNNIIEELINSKFEKDPDGDTPIDWKIIDRNKYENSYVLEVPYSHKDKDGHFQSLVSNLQYFSNRLESFCRRRNITLKKDNE